MSKIHAVEGYFAVEGRFETSNDPIAKPNEEEWKGESEFLAKLDQIEATAVDLYDEEDYAGIHGQTILGVFKDAFGEHTKMDLYRDPVTGISWLKALRGYVARHHIVPSDKFRKFVAEYVIKEHPKPAMTSGDKKRGWIIAIGAALREGKQPPTKAEWVKSQQALKQQV